MIVRFIIIFFFLFSPLFGETDKSKNDILYANLVGAALITGWGAVNWDYGKSAPHASNEQWFGRYTKSGGADKVGHMYASYFVATGLINMYENWGYGNKEAVLYGSLSSFFLMNYMEAGDAFSNSLGFSYEDFIMNTLGSFSGYLFATYPDLSRRIDLRMEYIPSLTTADLVTEYEKMKYIIAIKAEGFESITNPYLQYGELHLGYYTRHYTDGFSDESERVLYVGLGINFSRLARQSGYPTTGRLLNYYQLPYTYLPFEKDMNR